MVSKKGEDFTRNLVAGRQLRDVMFAVSRKEVKTARNGNPYISTRIGDKTGYVNATIWVRDIAESEALVKIMDDGSVIKVNGVVEVYQGSPTIKIETKGGGGISKADKGEYEISDFSAHTHRDIDKMTAEIKRIVAGMKNSHLKALCESLTGNAAILEKFQRSPAAESMHHNCVGGLIAHTYEVLRVCELAVSFHPELDADLLFTGALLHDIGKMDCYEQKEAAIVSKEKSRLVGHIPLGVIAVREAINKMRQTAEFPEELEDKLLHLIVSHHGDIEFGYGSSVNPRIPEAVVLFHADNLDSQAESAIAKIR